MLDGVRETYERHVGGVLLLEAGLVVGKQMQGDREFCKALLRSWAISSPRVVANDGWDHNFLAAVLHQRGRVYSVCDQFNLH